MASLHLPKQTTICGDAVKKNTYMINPQQLMLLRQKPEPAGFSIHLRYNHN